MPPSLRVSVGCRLNGHRFVEIESEGDALQALRAPLAAGHSATDVIDGVVAEPMAGSTGAEAALVAGPSDCKGELFVAVAVKACVPAEREPEVYVQAPLLFVVVVPISVEPS